MFRRKFPSEKNLEDEVVMIIYRDDLINIHGSSLSFLFFCFVWKLDLA